MTCGLLIIMSRFHLLEEFDEGKRSCRRRLAGHNRRRRKTQLDVNVNGNSLIDEQACGYLLISLLRILSNLQCNCCNLFIEYLQHVTLHGFLISSQLHSFCNFHTFLNSSCFWQLSNSHDTIHELLVSVTCTFFQ